MSIWQTQNWQKMLKNSSQLENTFIIDNLFIEKRHIFFDEFWLFVIWCNFSEIRTNTIDKLIKLCKKEKILFIQLENIDYFWVDKALKWKLDIWYYKKFIVPYTAVIDLKKSNEEILSSMKQKWRYNIKLAEKKWVVIKEVQKTEKNIKIYYDLMLETTKRDSFSWHSLDYYNNFLNSIEESKLLFAYFEDKVISAWIFVYYNKVAIYYYWVSSSDIKYRNLMSPYLLQWEAIKIWKEKWCEIYDFLWITDPLDKKSSLKWVTDFKLKLTNDTRKVSDSYIFINKKIKYNLIKILRLLKK